MKFFLHISNGQIALTSTIIFVCYKCCTNQYVDRIFVHFPGIFLLEDFNGLTKECRFRTFHICSKGPRIFVSSQNFLKACRLEFDIQVGNEKSLRRFLTDYNICRIKLKNFLYTTQLSSGQNCYVRNFRKLFVLPC